MKFNYQGQLRRLIIVLSYNENFIRIDNSNINTINYFNFLNLYLT